MPTVARVREGFSVHFNRGEVDDAFEVPLAFLMAPQNHGRERAEWNGLLTSVYAIPFNDRNIWGATAGILRNLWERVYGGGSRPTCLPEFVMVTARSDLRLDAQAAATGAICLLRKPFKTDALIDCLEKALNS